MKCRNCKRKTFKKIIKLGSQPISSRTHKESVILKKYPLDLYECQNCKLIQLSKVAPASEMYGSTYGYWTSLSKLMINHMSMMMVNHIMHTCITSGSRFGMRSCRKKGWGV